MQIDNIELLTADVDATAKFYSDKLNLPVERVENSAVIKAGTSKLIFSQQSGIEPVYHFAFNIPNNKLDEALDWIQRRVDIIDVTPGEKIADFVNWNAKSFYFFDNNGNILEYIARFNLDNASPKPFDTASVLCISEVGVVTDDVEAESDKLMLSNFTLFNMQPRMQNFCALGDDNGLLILSGPNRHWYPTNKWALKYPVKITLTRQGEACCLAYY